MFQKRFRNKGEFTPKRLCFFHTQEAGEYIRSIEANEQQDTPEKKERIPFEEQTKEAWQRVHERSNDTFQKIQEDATRFLPQDMGRKFSETSKIEIENIYKRSSMPKQEVTLWRSPKNNAQRWEDEKTLQENHRLLITEYPMPESFEEKGGTELEWKKLHVEI